MGVDEAAKTSTDTIRNLARDCIGKRKLSELKRSHPWLTEEIVKLKPEKAKDEGTAQEVTAVLLCSEPISKERRAYMIRTRRDIDKWRADRVHHTSSAQK